MAVQHVAATTDLLDRSADMKIGLWVQALPALSIWRLDCGGRQRKQSDQRSLFAPVHEPRRAGLSKGDRRNAQTGNDGICYGDWPTIRVRDKLNIAAVGKLASGDMAKAINDRLGQACRGSLSPCILEMPNA